MNSTAIPAKWLILAGEMLELAADKFSCHSCNDWEFPESWSMDERRQLVKAIADANGTPQDFDPECEPECSMDWLIMSFLAGRLKVQGEQS